MVRTAAIILCGGHSVRMGRPKAWLPFGDESLLGRTVQTVSGLAKPILVAAAVDQDLPALPDNVEITRDAQPDRGPLEGLAAGLRAIGSRAEATWLLSCDAPLLRREFLTALLDALPGHEAAIPIVDHQPYPLTACYSTSISPLVERMLASDRRRVRDLGPWLQTYWADEEFCRRHDPELHSLRNTNTPEEYAAALRIAGFTADGAAP